MSAHARSARLARWHVRLLLWGGGVLWASGMGWLGLHYFGQVHGEFGPQVNPGEPWLLRVHAAAMFVVLLGVGGLLVAHVGNGWSHRKQRWIGLALLVLLGMLTVSGYLLYYLADEAVRGWTSLLHWLTGVVLLPVFLWHYLRRRWLRGKAAAPWH